MQAENYEINYWAKIYDSFNVSSRSEKERKFYLRHAKKTNGKVLELGCGTGAILIPILKARIDAYGFDISQPMVNQLIKKTKKNGIVDIDRRIKIANMVDFKYPEKFALIIIPNRSFLHILNQESQIRTLNNIREHLKEG